MKASYAGFECHGLDSENCLWTGQLPEHLAFSAEEFSVVWAMHPPEFHEIKMHGRPVKTPRWQQAYGTDYHYTGRVNKALPIPPRLVPLWEWAKQTIDARLNGLLLNWYDGQLGHYIGRHRDSTTHRIEGAPIVTISLGAARTFRLRPYRGPGRADFPVRDGSVLIIPFVTNESWTHEVPKGKRDAGRRISVTMRAFAVTAMC
jgi:alkylated DNA repair dioxygenase AlkB